ncbi:group 4 capsule polysaccharide lipoprotein GfcB/YjbF [Thioclava sp. ES.031]|uniref:YjbF family lipoprotein n=1 Tax=Thioclava sp. ES.031 TaxID=1798203 RepID=UPI000BF8E4BA|nr:YjbF family lipoprotein [Thioclava sp. ES.031]PFG63226.1 group 4 capsule polysaccharide lipoprotein GfcB/YjbF [Thioclava sp. ES.031]
MRSLVFGAALLALGGCAQLENLSHTVTLSGSRSAGQGATVPTAPAKGEGVSVKVVTQTAPARGLEVVIPSRDANAVLSLAGRNGTVETWRTDDHITVSVDRGVVVATRGLGDDLMAADSEPTLAALRGTKIGPYRRTYRFLTADNHSDYVLLGCDMSTVGNETLVGLKLLRHEEQCRNPAMAVTNIYWTDKSGLIQAGRQWVSPTVGQIAIGVLN